MKRYRWNHAMIASAITVVAGIPTSPIIGATTAIVFYSIREVYQEAFLNKGNSLRQHIGDALAAALGAVPTAGVMMLLELWIYVP